MSIFQAKFGVCAVVVAASLLSVTGRLCADETLPAERVKFFEQRVRPVLVQYCYECHSAAAPELKGGLRLDSRDGWTRGGESGEPALRPGSPDDSLLIRVVRHAEPGLEMPPEGPPLSPAVIADLATWIKLGAVDPRVVPPAEIKRADKSWWSLQPLSTVEPPVPAGLPEAWARGPIDRFVLAKLREQGLEPNPPADRRTLARRVWYDLAGLPPSPEQVEAFVADNDPQAYEQLVERLLASPRYGERWGRHWLDVVRFGESNGFERNLPAYVAIQDVRGEPPNGKANWSSGFLPAQHQAVALSAQQPLRNLAGPASISAEEERETRDFLRLLNDSHRARHPAEGELAARMAVYELAARMQLSAPEVADLARESTSAHAAYGTDDRNPLKAAYSRNCLLARRLLEQGVRFVSLYCASRASAVDGLLNWDAHRTLKSDYERHGPVFDQPTAALLSDLMQRGMLRDVLVLWTTEFGRMPTRQAATQGRDHNPDAFTCWMMGAGIKGGVSYGATDDFGRRSVERVASAYDFYATVLHLLGLDHRQVTYYHNGANRRLTDVHGHVIGEVLA